MIDERAARRKRRAAAPLLALAGALAFTAAGCGGKSEDQQASETYANSVCSTVADWETQVKSIATDLSGGVSQASLESKVTQVQSATKSLATDIKNVPPPNTSDGQAAKQQLNQLSTDLEATVAAAQSAVTGLQADASAATVAAAAVALAPQVKTLATSAQSTVSTLQASKGDISSAFKSADSCKSLGGSS
jgi:hypothetical protein